MMAGTLSGAIAIGQSVGAALSGGSNLTADTSQKRTTAASLTGVGNLDVASALSKFDRNSPFSAPGSITVVTSQIYTNQPNLAATGQLTADAGIAFEPFTEENATHSSSPIPVGCSGVWVTLIGAGGAGGAGDEGSSGSRLGGSGGGGGAKIARMFVPVASLGPTYSTAQPLGPSNSTVAGGTASFTSGSIQLLARGGAGGKNASGSIAVSGW
jgi:hypothetical protein